MHEMRIYQYACTGPSCHRCEELMPGFITKHSGKILISDTFLKKKNSIIQEAIESCPTSALFLDELP